MRIIYLHQYFNTPQMSGGTRSFEMAKRFVSQGHEVHVVTSFRENTKHKGWFKTKEQGIHVHWLSVPYSNKMSFARRNLAFAHFAFAALKRAIDLNGDVILATSTPLTIAIPGVGASKFLNVPMVFEVRDLWPELPIAVGALKNPLSRTLALWLERFAYRNAKRIVALSPGMRDGIVRTGYPSENIRVIPNSCDITRFRGESVSAERFLAKYPHLRGKQLVMYTGTMGLINGVSYLVYIAAEMKKLKPDVHFVVIGSGKEEHKVRLEAERNGVLGINFTLLPRLAKAEMPDALAAATIATSLFVDLPQMWHNSANKFFDALAAGRPVMINYQGWHADIIRKNGLGIVVPANHAEHAAHLLADFLNDPVGIRNAGVAAARIAEEEFDRDLLASQLLEVLEDAVGVRSKLRTIPQEPY